MQHSKKGDMPLADMLSSQCSMLGEVSCAKGCDLPVCRIITLRLIEIAVIERKTRAKNIEHENHITAVTGLYWLEGQSSFIAK